MSAAYFAGAACKRKACFSDPAEPALLAKCCPTNARATSHPPSQVVSRPHISVPGCRTGRQPQPGRECYDACLLGCTLHPPQPTPWGATNLALAPLTAVVNGINTCMTWGCAGQNGQGEAAATVVPAAGEVRVIEILEEGEGVEGPAAAGPSPAKPLLRSAAGQPQQPAPEWLKSLFKRR